MGPIIQPDPTAARLERALREQLRGEIRFDAKSRLLYSTDASIYQLLPLGVVCPRDTQEVETAVRVAAEHGVAVLPRGGGTGLAGQTVAAALVLDFSKHMNRILALDPAARRARVQPGVRLDRLNRAAAPHGLHFGPDPATLRQCCVGGMIGNNACGARSVVYGKTGDHVHGVDCVLPDGDAVRFGPIRRDAVATAPGREGELARAVLEILGPREAQVLERYPDVPRRVSGYNFDTLLRAPELNLAQLIVGSEGTLATVTEAELGLVELPRARALVVLAWDDRYAPLDAVPLILGEPGLSALEIVDDRILRSARELLEHRASAQLVPASARGVLYVEFTGEAAEEARDHAERFAARARGFAQRPQASVYTGSAEQDRAWALRRAGLGLLYRTIGDVKPVPFVEDTGVPPERLGEYTRRFDQIVARHETTTGFFGHAGQGCLHIRVDLNLKRGEEVQRMRRIARDVAELVVEFGGSLSGEHGDGLARSEFLPLMFGSEVMELHRRTKRVFDPEGRMNPGKIVDAPPMTESLRFGEAYRAEPPQRTWFDYSREGGWDRAVEKCNGMAICRKLDAGTMCPSFMVTLEEEHSTRGRANSLREAMRGSLDGMRSEAVLEALDLCLECKACKTECPVGVDMARYKSEFLAQHYEATGHTPASAHFFGRIHDFARAGSLAPQLANLGSRMLGGVVKQLSHVDARRTIPALAARPFRRPWTESHPRDDGRPPVILLDDTFHNYFQPAPLRAAVQVLERAGFAVSLPRRQVCCGRAAISKGLLDDARRHHARLIEVLGPAAERGVPIVGVEPSCILTLRDELPDLARDPRTAALAENSFTLEEFLADHTDWQPGRLERRAVVHGHCHQKALVGMEPTRRLLERVQGLQFEILDSGCCGMAGSFGYEQGHYEVSRACGERVLFPAVRASDDALVVAPGYSCRTQIADFCDGRSAVHTAELLEMAG